MAYTFDALAMSVKIQKKVFFLQKNMHRFKLTLIEPTRILFNNDYPRIILFNNPKS
jgi:hypothetical protein